MKLILKSKTMKHTPEPWQASLVKDGEKYDGTYIWSEKNNPQPNGSWLMICRVSTPDDHTDLDDANAARIVECVNAMEGIENPSEFMEVVKKLELDAYQKLKQQIQESELINVVAKDKAPEAFKKLMLNRLTADELTYFDNAHPLYYTAAVEVFTELYDEFLKFQIKQKPKSCPK